MKPLRTRFERQDTMSELQVVCKDTGESDYYTAEFKPDANIWRAGCDCGCGAAEYREEL